MKRVAISLDDSEYAVLQGVARSRGLKPATFVYTVIYRDYILPAERENRTETQDLFAKKKGGK